MSGTRYIRLVDGQPAQTGYTGLGNVTGSIEVSMTEQSQKKEGKKLIRFNQCKCGMKVFCRMFGKKPDCDEVVPDYPKAGA